MSDNPPEYWTIFGSSSGQQHNSDGNSVIQRDIDNDNHDNTDSRTTNEQRNDAHDKTLPPYSRTTDYGHELIEAAQAGSLRRVEHCLSHNVDVDRIDNGEWTALHWAAYRGDESIARALIKAGFNVNATSAEHSTPLHEATDAANESIVKLLLKHGANVKLADIEKRTALHRAANRGLLGIARALIEAGCNVNAFSSRHGSPLCRAVDSGHESMVQLLLKKGAQVNYVHEGRHGGILHTACAADQSKLSIVQMLLRAGAKPDVSRYRNMPREEWYLTPPECFLRPPCHPVGCYTYGSSLSIAISRGQSDVVNALVSAGHDVNAFCTSTVTQSNGSHEDVKTAVCRLEGKLLQLDIDVLIAGGAPVARTSLLLQSSARPLDWAVWAVLNSRRGASECLQTLLTHGADVAKIPAALTLLAQKGRAHVIEMLVDHGADVDGPSWSSIMTPLMAAVSADFLLTAELLLARGASPNVQREKVCEGQTALHLAQSAQSVRLLARHGADLDARDHFGGRTPLMTVTKRGRLLAMGALLDLGANVHMRTSGGRTAYDFAVVSGDPERMKILKQHGAKPSGLRGLLDMRS